MRITKSRDRKNIKRKQFSQNLALVVHNKKSERNPEEKGQFHALELYSKNFPQICLMNFLKI